jgi:hypothetical protein
MVTAVTLRGLYLVGNKRAQRIRAVHTVDSAGKSITLRLREYISRGFSQNLQRCRGRKTLDLDPVI